MTMEIFTKFKKTQKSLFDVSYICSYRRTLAVTILSGSARWKYRYSEAAP